MISDWQQSVANLSAITLTNIYQSFTYKMAAKIYSRRYGTILRHCHHMYRQVLALKYSTLFG